ncbi:hypothetical protein Naga_101124g1 [Nannochloropsis gaditana]|uniref:Uncharacterized protein n=1 Tax=Nannochloropsis gaditana TaxID=72520 RepID=W7T7U5_9STRA|nr:hypothetical protein Naga_101124g1 [Nannochloropsis gaditana]
MTRKRPRNGHDNKHIACSHLLLQSFSKLVKTGYRGIYVVLAAQPDAALKTLLHGWKSMGGKGKSIVIVEDKEGSDAGAAAADNVQKEQLRPSSPPRHEHCAPCPPRTSYCESAPFSWPLFISRRARSNIRHGKKHPTWLPLPLEASRAGRAVALTHIYAPSPPGPARGS